VPVPRMSEIVNGKQSLLEVWLGDVGHAVPRALDPTRCERRDKYSVPVEPCMANPGQGRAAPSPRQGHRL
jgi:hypothetical protein